VKKAGVQRYPPAAQVLRENLSTGLFRGGRSPNSGGRRRCPAAPPI